MDTYGAHHRAKKPQAPRRSCHRCRGTGIAPCRVCGGRGQVACGRDGNGHPRLAACTGCMGRKTARCATCGGARLL